MRTIVMLMFLSVAGTCFAEDPLETLNSIEDTLSTMEHTLNAQAAEQGEVSGTGTDAARQARSFDRELYFISDEPLGARGWVRVRPCIGEGAPDPGRCVAPAGESGESGNGSRFWKSRAASPEELQLGTVVIASDKATGGEWFLAKVTDLSGLDRGQVGVSAPVAAQLPSLRVVEE